MNCTMMRDNLLVKQEDATKTTKGGIVLPDNAALKPLRGKIVNLSKTIDDELHIGDEILFDRYAGTLVVIDDEEYLVMKPEDVLLILNKE